MQKTVQNESVSPFDRARIGERERVRPVDTSGKIDGSSGLASMPEPLVPMEAKTPRLMPRYFKNDLTPERKEELVKQFSDSMRAELDNDLLSVNFVARLVNRQHRQVRSILFTTESVTEAVDQLLDKTGKYVDRLIAKLTPEQREVFRKKLQDG